ncbi:MAG: hypothetical protein RL186_1008 [Pseudomonadota bacterium]
MTQMTLAIVPTDFEATKAAQAIASDPAISVWANANAGAGKTKVLIDRIARLLLAGANPGHILAVTYTKAAAAEMQTRLYDKLGSWTIANDTDLRAALLELDPHLDLEAQGTLPRARSLFARALETPGGLKIQTIHGFCQTILQRFPLEAGVPAHFDVLDDAGKAALVEQAYEQAALDAPEVFLELAVLTSQMDNGEAVRKAYGKADERAAMLSRGEDWGARLAQSLSLASEAGPEEIVAQALESIDVPALRAAQAALAESGSNDKKLSAKLEVVLGDSDLVTRWDALLSMFLTDKGTVRDGQIYTQKLAKNPAVIMALGPYDVWPSALCEATLATDDQRRKALLLHNSVLLNRAVAAFARTWPLFKRAHGCLDYDDLIEATATLLQAGEGAARWVLYKLDAGISHILIDEAQDTAPNQWDLLAPLFKELEEEARDQIRTRFVVGDAKQSIYSFQGARPDRFESEMAKFEAGGAIRKDGRRSLTFDLSFRTGQTILNAVDAVWTFGQTAVPPVLRDNVSEDDPLEVKYAFTSRHKAHRSNQIGAVELWPLTPKPAPQDPSEAWDHGQKNEREDSARNTLADQIAREIKRRLDDGMAVWDKDQSRPLVAGDIMILVQSRGPLFHQIIRRLKFHRVPVAGADRIKLVEDAAVQDLIALARFALLPEDDFNTACVLKGAFCGLLDDDQHLYKLAYDREDHSLWARLQASEVPEHVAIAHFLRRVAARGVHLPAYEFFAAILELPLVDQSLSPAPPFSRTGWHALIERLGREVRDPVEALLHRALDHGRRSSPSLHAFISLLETDATDVKREMEQGSNGVRVMTIHGAKGLEAPVVILPETTANKHAGNSDVQFDHKACAFLWSPAAHNDPDSFAQLREKSKTLEQQEKARLLYVAMTRARDLLILCGHETGNSAAGMGKGCWYETFQMALPVLGEGEMIAVGDVIFQKWGAYAPAAAPMSTQIAAPPVPLPDWFDKSPVQDGKGPRRIAPSALASAGSEPPALSPLAPDARKRFLRGRLIHELLQRLPDLPQADWQAAAHRRLAREADLDEATKTALISETLAVLNQPEFKAIFGPGSRAEAAIAGRGIGLPDDMVVNGSVDRLVVTDTQVLVLDFKTNRPPPQRVEDVAEVYLNQMAAYRALLQATWPDKAVTCALLWTDGPFLMELPQPSLDEALRRIAALPS